MRNRKIPTCNLIWISSFIAILFMATNLIGCASVTGNVVPKSGPKMESVYDSMQASDGNKKLSDIQTEVNKQVPKPSDYDFKKYQKSGLKDFKQIPNPELPLYIYPHFAGQEQVPVPGYFTGFSVYERNLYVISG